MCDRSERRSSSEEHLACCALHHRNMRKRQFNKSLTLECLFRSQQKITFVQLFFIVLLVHQLTFNVVSCNNNVNNYPGDINRRQPRQCLCWDGAKWQAESDSLPPNEPWTRPSNPPNSLSYAPQPSVYKSLSYAPPAPAGCERPVSGLPGLSNAPSAPLYSSPLSPSAPPSTSPSKQNLVAPASSYSQSPLTVTPYPSTNPVPAEFRPEPIKGGLPIGETLPDGGRVYAKAKFYLDAPGAKKPISYSQDFIFTPMHNGKFKPVPMGNFKTTDGLRDYNEPYQMYKDEITPNQVPPSILKDGKNSNLFFPESNDLFDQIPMYREAPAPSPAFSHPYYKPDIQLPNSYEKLQNASSEASKPDYSRHPKVKIITTLPPESLYSYTTPSYAATLPVTSKYLGPISDIIKYYNPPANVSPKPYQIQKHNAFYPEAPAPASAYNRPFYNPYVKTPIYGERLYPIKPSLSDAKPTVSKQQNIPDYSNHPEVKLITQLPPTIPTKNYYKSSLDPIYVDRPLLSNEVYSRGAKKQTSAIPDYSHHPEVKLITQLPPAIPPAGYYNPSEMHVNMPMYTERPPPINVPSTGSKKLAPEISDYSRHPNVKLINQLPPSAGYYNQGMPVYTERPPTSNDIFGGGTIRRPPHMSDYTDSHKVTYSKKLPPLSPTMKYYKNPNLHMPYRSNLNDAASSGTKTKQSSYGAGPVDYSQHPEVTIITNLPPVTPKNPFYNKFY